MKYKDLFDQFDTEGRLVLPDMERAFSDVPWSRHPVFEGVELKHIVTAAQTDGQFSFHLVLSGSGVCVNGGTAIAYEPGVITVLPKNVPHEVTAGGDGLYLFAKFMPALN